MKIIPTYNVRKIISDGAKLKSEKIHPELRSVFKYIPPLPLHNRKFLFVMNFLLKNMPKAKSNSEVQIEEKRLANTGLRIYKPYDKLSGAGLLWVHGGGLITGTAGANDPECLAYARDLKLVVVSVEYRLAPKYPFPAAIDDCFDAWRWMQQSADKLGINPSRIAISGQSSGGGLTASLAHRIFDGGGVQPAAQALFCPMLDDRTALRYELDIIQHPLWNNKSNRAAWTWYLGQSAGALNVPPYAVPARREDLSGLPDTWISIGDIELFYEEAVQYAARLNEAGVNCELYLVPMAPHSFNSIQPKASLTRNLYDENYRFLQKALGL